MLRSAAPRGVPPLSVEGSGSGSAPTTFGPFRVLHQLGAGTLGPVFRAHDPTEGRLVAVKTFHLDLTPETAVALAQELQAVVAKDLTHPSVAAPLAAGLEGATPWLAQAYIPAESLDGALRQYGPAPTAHVVTIVTHLAGALDFAAVSGVGHGALHPRDVLVAPDETFLVDLGVAPALERCGLRPPLRRPYSAPERIAGEPVSRRADIFALAAIAFEILTGQPIAGPGRAAGDTLPDVLGADIPELRRLFASALAVDPAERPDSALAFAAAFKTALGTASFRATPAREPRPARRITPPPAPVLPLGQEASGVAVEPDGPTLDDRGPDLGAPHGQPRSTFALPSVPASPEAPPPSSPPPESPYDPLAGDFRDAGETRPVARAADVGSTAPGPAEMPVPARSRVAREPSRRVISVPVLAALVLFGVLAGFGLGWLWVSSGGDSSVPTSTAVPGEGEVRTETEGAVTGAVAPDAGSQGEPASALDSSVPSGMPGDPSAQGEAPGEVPPGAALAGEEAATDGVATGDGATTDAGPAIDVPAPGQRRPAAPVARGRLQVSSTPNGARVEVNGRDRGRTPLTLGDLPLGGHTIVVSRSGYRPERRRVTLTRNRASQSVRVPLRASVVPPAAGGQTAPERAETEGFFGTIVVESRPTPARVFIDGREAGRTPLVVPNVRAGSHVVRIELDGHRTWTSAVRVVAGERRRVTASLEELSR